MGKFIAWLKSLNGWWFAIGEFACAFIALVLPIAELAIIPLLFASFIYSFVVLWHNDSISHEQLIGIASFNLGAVAIELLQIIHFIVR